MFSHVMYVNTNCGRQGRRTEELYEIPVPLSVSCVTQDLLMTSISRNKYAPIIAGSDCQYFSMTKMLIVRAHVPVYVSYGIIKKPAKNTNTCRSKPFCRHRIESLFIVVYDTSPETMVIVLSNVRFSFY